MNKSRISVTREVLKDAIIASPYTVNELEKRSSLTNIKKWLNGTLQPTIRQLEIFSDYTMTPFGYLLLDKSVRYKPPIQYIKHSSQNTISKPLELILLEIEGRVDFLNEYNDTNEIMNSNKILGSFSNLQLDYKKIALDMRKKLLMDNYNGKNLTSKMQYIKKMAENFWILTASGKTPMRYLGYNYSIKFDLNEFRGFVMPSNFVQYIFINGNDRISFQLYTLILGLASIWIGKGYIFNNDYLNSHNTCTQIADEFLLPEYEIKEKTKHDIKKISSKLQISECFVAKRMMQMNIMSKKHYKNIIQANINNITKSQHLSKMHERYGMKYASCVIDAVNSEQILLREGYSLLKNFATYQKYDRLLRTL